MELEVSHRAGDRGVRGFCGREEDWGIPGRTQAWASAGYHWQVL